ncbi:MAG: replicative DNA helicase [Acidimicrobiia bacterium]
MSGITEQGQMRPGYRNPPHSREAEESVIGAVLLSEEAVNEVMDRLHPPDFYIPAHQAIFEAMRELFDTNQAIDAVTVSEALRRRGELDKVGGVSYLARLVDIVPSTSNILYYSGIVEEHAKRRELIRAGASVTDVAFDIDEEIARVLDRAEQAVLSVAERRSAQTLLEVGPLFSDVLEHIELLEQRGSELTGLATGYVDLDKKLAGLQASNLVVVAARPAMGKSSLALGVAINAATQGEPVAIFSLEMSKEEIVQRILSSVGRVDSMKLRSGQLGPLWQRVVDAAGKMYQAPIYIDDSPVVTVTDIRAKCRRLKRKKGLSLVVIDYLQLMEASNRENRQQEISEITRNLKNLARELEVPVIAVSQLNRSLETREDKRPRLSDLRESGCLTADTRLVRADNNAEVTLGELVESGATDIPVWSLDDRYRLVASNLTRAFSSGVKPVFELELASGRTVRASGNHPFLTVDGWVRLDDIQVGDRLAVTRRMAPSKSSDPMTDDQLIVLAHMIGDGCHLARHAMQYTTVDAENADIVAGAAARAFGVMPRLKQEGTWLQLYLAAPQRLARGKRNPLAEWLDDLGLFDKRSYEKFIPAPVFTLPRDQLALFVRHLWATDGCVWTDGSLATIYYASSSRRLAVDVQSLLTRLDVQARVRRVRQRNGRDQYHVIVQGHESRLNFLEGVGVAGPRGRTAEAMIPVVASRNPNPNVDSIPASVWEYVRSKAMPAAGMSARELARRLGMSYCGSALYKSGISRARLKRLAGILDDEHLNDLAESDVLWDRVVSITPRGEEEVFDATVELTHNFLANGIVAHNSIEQDADVVMFIYRHEYYHPEEQERKGIAEVIVAKHRAGSTGPVEMTFQPEFTRFANLGRDVT